MRRVLIVDDEENIRLVLRTILRKNGYETEVADNGEDALAKLDVFGPDFILTDVRMPKLGGLDLLSTLKAKQHAATVKAFTPASEQRPGSRLPPPCRQLAVEENPG